MSRDASQGKVAGFGALRISFGRLIPAPQVRPIRVRCFRQPAGLAVILLTVGALGAAPVAAAKPGQAAPIDVLVYRIALELSPEAAEFRARAEISFLVREGDLDRVRFDLVGLSVDSVAVGGRLESFGRDAGALEIELGRAAAAGDTIAVEVFYHGAPEDGLYFRRNSHGHATVFADNWPNRARYWFPSIDHPSDKARVEFWVRSPPQWTVVANGRLVNELVAGDGRKLTVWATDSPIPVYTMVIGAAEMTVRDLGALGCRSGADRCLRISQWVYPEDEETARRTFRRAGEIVAFYDSLIGPFPYEKLALVESTTRFGGMENSSAIFFPEREVRRGDSDGLLAHEIAHQWFGDAVTEREWNHLWLSEGFATYFASVFFEFADGDSFAGRRRTRNEVEYLESAVVDRPLIDAEPADLFELLNANSYQKGAWVLHMLRQVVGDQAFFAGVRSYVAGHLHGNALSVDLRRVMEQASGQELSWFFDQWLRRPGYPRVEVRSSWDDASGSLVLEIEQLQPWPPFRFPLELEAEGEGYRLRRRFSIAEEKTRLRWSLPGPPARIVTDPDNWLLGPVNQAR